MAKEASLIPAHRRYKILDFLVTEGAARVDELGKLFAVSEMTVRRDLDALEGEGLLERTHGGAVIARRVPGESPYRAKAETNREGKEAIGRLVDSLVEDGETVVVNSGSTTYHVLRFLVRRRGLHIITNNVAAVTALGEEAEAEIILLGGSYRAPSGCVVGDSAIRQLEETAPFRAVIGTDGLSLKAGMSSPILEEAAVTRRMIKQTQGTIVVVADKQKIGRTAGFLTASLEVIDVLVTDEKPHVSWMPELEKSGIKVLHAQV